MPSSAKTNDWLSRCAEDQNIPNYTSQRGEDRILQVLFREIGVDHKWCVEFGAADGHHRSNTWYWINNDGWASVQIEAARDKNLNPYIPWRDSFDALQQRYKHIPRVICLNRFIGTDHGHRLDDVLAGTALPPAFDLLSLDVDGAEYDIWQSIQHYQPRVVVIEHNKTIPIEVEFHSNRGSSLRALTALGKNKGYELAAANDLNGVFVRRENFNKLGIQNNAPEQIWRGQGAVRLLLEEKNEDLVLRGEDRLRWVRGMNGTITGQIKAGKYLTIAATQNSLPPSHLPIPRRYLSGYVRHWWHTTTNHL